MVPRVSTFALRPKPRRWMDPPNRAIVVGPPPTAARESRPRLQSKTRPGPHPRRDDFGVPRGMTSVTPASASLGGDAHGIVALDSLGGLGSLHGRRRRRDRERVVPRHTLHRLDLGHFGRLR